MATRRFTAGDIVAVVFDSDFGISNGSRMEKISTLTGAMQKDRRRLHEETIDTLTIEKMLVVLMLQMLKTSKRTQK